MIKNEQYSNHNRYIANQNLIERSGIVRSAILEKDGNCHTYLGKVFSAIGNEHENYNWLITNCECFPADKNIYELFSQEYTWLSGKQFTEIIQKDDFQFIWGVFSGFSPEISLKEILKYDLPYADGNEGFWVDDVKIQHPLAEVEIVAWDSSLTLVISKNDDLVKKFRDNFHSSVDLSAQNAKQNSEIAHIQELLTAELVSRDIEVNEKSLYQKYSIWRELYLNNKANEVTDLDILRCIKIRI